MLPRPCCLNGFSVYRRWEVECGQDGMGKERRESGANRETENRKRATDM